MFKNFTLQIFSPGSLVDNCCRLLNIDNDLETEFDLENEFDLDIEYDLEIDLCNDPDVFNLLGNDIVQSAALR